MNITGEIDFFNWSVSVRNSTLPLLPATFKVEMGTVVVLALFVIFLLHSGHNVIIAIIRNDKISSFDNNNKQNS